MKEVICWLLVLGLLIFAGAAIVTHDSVTAADNCQQYADKAVALVDSSRRYGASWGQVESIQGLVYATLYSGCRGR